MDMKDKNARSRMESLFVSYHKLLRRHGVSWIVKNNQKVAVGHVLSCIKPATLQSRLQSNLEFSHHSLKKDFKGFMKHSIRISEAFQMVDTGPKQTKSESHRSSRSGNKSNRTPNGNTIPRIGSSHRSHSRPLPDCPHGPCKSKGLKHLIKDCPDATPEEKDRMLKELSAAKARDGPARSTSSQASAAASNQSEKSATKTSGTAGRLCRPRKIQKDNLGKPSCPMILSDGLASLERHGICDDGSDDTIVSPKLAETAVLKGIGKLKAITPITLSVALKSQTEAETFSFSRSWTVPRTVLQLSSGQLALTNVTFLVADNELTCEDILIGNPLLKHLKIYMRTLLEENRAQLDGSD